MSKNNVIELEGREANADLLTGLLQAGAHQLIEQAVEAELQELLARHATRRTESGHAGVVRNGYLPARELQTSLGPVTVKIPKVRAKTGEPVTFQSALVPPYIRKTRSLEAALPWLYLKGISSGEMGAALEVLVGPKAKGLSASTVSRLKQAWGQEYRHWSDKRLELDQWVYVWADGVYSGRRFVWSGKLEEGYPTVAALAAAPFAEQPMAFISNGGYDFTASLVAPVRTAGAKTFSQLAFPNSQFPENENLKDLSYFGDASYAAIQQARAERLTRLRMQESLPKRMAQMEQLETVRSSDVQLEVLLDFLPDEVSSGLKGQAEIALAAFASGLAVSANLSASGFDTHGDHDVDQTSSLVDLLDGIDHLWGQIEAHGLEDKVTVIIGSDFGRTPFYNSGDGKDHWNITSIMAMGAGITGNRVIGETNENFEAMKLKPDTLAADSDGIIVTPQHVHRSLRDILGVQSDLDSPFPIAVESLDLFS